MVHAQAIVLAFLTLLSLAIPTAAGPSNTIRSHKHTAGTATAAAVSGDIKLVGHVGGIVAGLAIQGSFAYVGISSELAVLDISDPGHPTRVGSVVLPNYVRSIAVVGQYAYVLTTGSDLAIVDISHPEAPLTIAITAIKANKFVVAGRYLYALSDDLHIYDLSNPAAPVQVGYAPFGGSALAQVGRYLYIGFLGFHGSNIAGLRIIDIANPAAPALVSEYTMPVTTPYLPTDASDIVIDRHYAYITLACCESPATRLVVDVSDPARPKRIGLLPGSASSMAIAGRYLFMADRNILRVVDIARPDRPSLLLAYIMPRGFYAQAYAPPTIKLAGRYLYFAAEDAVEVVDISRPNAPSIIGAYLTLTHAGSTAVAGHYAYVNAAYGGLQVLDVADPANPIRVGWLPGDVQDLAVGGNYAYLAMNDTPSTIRVVDISVPADPVVVGALKYDTRLYVRRITISGDYLYLAESQGLRILDISHALAPAEVALLPGLVGSVTVANHYAYVVLNDTDNPRLEIVDVANPAAPTKSGFFPVRATDVAVVGRYAYLASDILRVVDISDPAAPYLVGTLISNGNSVAVHGRYAYMGDGLGLDVIDVADPAHPVDAGTYSTPMCGGCSPYPSMLTVANGYAFLSQGDGGMFTFRFGKAISGRMTHANGLPAPLAGITISAGAGMTATTDLSGAFTLENIPGNPRTLTPSSAGYIFSPESRVVTNSSDARGQDFVALTGPVTATLGPGTPARLVSTDTQGLPTQLDYSAEAVATNTTLVLTPTIAEGTRGWAFAGHAFDLSASQSDAAAPDLAFGAPVTVTISYSSGDTRLVSDPNRLALQWWNGSVWQDAAETCSPAASYTRDPIARKISVGICRTGRFALFGPTRQIYLPQS